MALSALIDEGEMTGTIIAGGPRQVNSDGGTGVRKLTALKGVAGE
jgi:hypothetical protein